MQRRDLQKTRKPASCNWVRPKIALKIPAANSQTHQIAPTRPKMAWNRKRATTNQPVCTFCAVVTRTPLCTSAGLSRGNGALIESRLEIELGLRC